MLRRGLATLGRADAAMDGPPPLMVVATPSVAWNDAVRQAWDAVLDGPAIREVLGRHPGAPDGNG